MRLSELHPRWIHANMFVFECPHCHKTGRQEPVLLTCKNVEMTRQQTWDIIRAALGEDCELIVVPPKPKFAWTISGTRPNDPKAAFAEDCTVTPSIDASDSGHWHGYITNGEIVGGV
jgi:hypothetical protein